MTLHHAHLRDRQDVLVEAVKYQALGNDYWVIDRPRDAVALKDLVRSVPAICERHRGLGSDGVLVHDPRASRITIFNPDGSIAERSGNGLRIAVAHAVLEHHAGAAVTIRTSSSEHAATVHQEHDGTVVSTVTIGRIGVGPDAEGVGSPVDVMTSLGKVRAYRLSVGNPHCVVFGLPVTEDVCRTYGPEIEHHVMFPRRTNVQFVEVTDRGHVRIEIWERGAGRTLASGTSATAAAIAMMQVGLADDSVEVIMAGGRLQVRRASNGMLYLTGPAARVCLARFRLSDLSSGSSLGPATDQDRQT